MLARRLDRLFTALLQRLLRLLLPVPDGTAAALPPRGTASVFEAEAFDRCADTRLRSQTTGTEGFSLDNGLARARHG